MNSLLASGLFDNPLLVVIFLLVGAISNWLMKRRQQGGAAEDSPAAPHTPTKPREEFNLEEALRRMLGEEAPPVAPPPPIIPRVISSPPSSVEARLGKGEARRRGSRVAAIAATVTGSVAQAVEAYEAAAHRITAEGELNQQAARSLARLRGQSRRTALLAAQWRGPQKTRQAFVASLVFGPPKGMDT